MQTKISSHRIRNLWLWSQFLWDYCWNSPYLRFLNIGFVNIAFLLAVGVIFDYYLRDFLPTFLIALLVSIFHVSFSFVSRKIFIYKTKGNWLKEYLRCFMLYGGSILIYSLLMWLFVDGLHMYFFVAQIVSLLSGKIYYSIASYFYFMPKADFIPEAQLQALKKREPENITIQENITNVLPTYTTTLEIATTERTNNTNAKKNKTSNSKHIKTAKVHFGILGFLQTQKDAFFHSFEEFKERKQRKKQK